MQETPTPSDERTSTPESRSSTLVIPTQKLEASNLVPTGKGTDAFRPFMNGGHLRQFFALANQGILVPRTAELEQNPEFQQPILSCILVNPETKKFLIFQKDMGQKEDQRLEGMDHPFVGDHIVGSDGSLQNSLYRELSEELSASVDSDSGLRTLQIQDALAPASAINKRELHELKKNVRIRPVGIIRNTDDEIGRSHIGVVCLMELRNPNINISQNPSSAENTRYQWITLEEYQERTKPSGEIHPARWTEIAVEKILTPYFS